MRSLKLPVHVYTLNNLAQFDLFRNAANVIYKMTPAFEASPIVNFSMFLSPPYLRSRPDRVLRATVAFGLLLSDAARAVVVVFL